MPDDRIPIVQSNRAEIDTFFAKARALATATKSVPDSRPRLIFALDATASREPTWTMARELQVEMFQEAAKSGLDVQLVFYRGRECQASPWISDASQLAKLMMGVECRTGLFSACKPPNAKSGKAQEEEVQELQNGERDRCSDLANPAGAIRFDNL